MERPVKELFQNKKSQENETKKYKKKKPNC